MKRKKKNNDKKQSQESFFFQSQTSTSVSPVGSVGKRDSCSATKSVLFGFAVGAMLAGMLTGGWMKKAGSPILTFLSSRRRMTRSTNPLRNSCVVGSYSFLATHWFDCLEWMTLYFFCPGNKKSNTRMMRIVYVHYILWFVWPMTWGMMIVKKAVTNIQRTKL